MSNKRDIFDKIFVIIFTLFMLIYFGHNNIFKNVLGFKLYLYQTFAILLTIICFFKCIKEKKIIIVNKTYIIWLILFIMYCIFSIAWSIDSKYCYSAIIFMLFNFLIFFDLMIYCTDKEKIFNIMKIYILSITYMCIRLILFEKGKPGSMYYGNIVGLYFNNIALILSFGIAISILLYVNSQKSKRILYILLIVIFYYIIYLTGSRKGLLLPIAFYLFYYFINNKKNIKKDIKLILIIAVGLIFAYYVLKNNDRLNFRMMELFESFLGQKVSDLSVNERSFFRKTAIKLFLHNPLIGIGINNFAAYMKQISYSHVAYSHCNFTEILSNLGICGFTLYYFIYFYIIKKAIVLLHNKKNKTVLYYSIILILIMLIFEYGFVSYYLFETQIQIFICYLLVNVEEVKGVDYNE